MNDYFSVINELDPATDEEEPLSSPMLSDESVGKIAGKVSELSVPSLKQAIVEALDSVRRHDIKINESSVDSHKKLGEKVRKLISTVEQGRAEYKRSHDELVKVIKDLSNARAEDKRSFELLQRRIEALSQAQEGEVVPKVKSQPPSPRLCFFCDLDSHIVANCPTRKHCFGCASNLHPYEKCEFKMVKCERCKLIGHTERVHQAQDMVLREELYKAHPQEFNHFLQVEQDRRPDNSTPRMGLQKPLGGGGFRGRGRRDGRGRGGVRGRGNQGWY